jgi:hypothetical protein
MTWTRAHGQQIRPQQCMECTLSPRAVIGQGLRVNGLHELASMHPTEPDVMGSLAVTFSNRGTHWEHPLGGNRGAIPPIEPKEQALLSCGSTWHPPLPPPLPQQMGTRGRGAAEAVLHGSAAATDEARQSGQELEGRLNSVLPGCTTHRVRQEQGSTLGSYFEPSWTDRKEMVPMPFMQNNQMHVMTMRLKSR